MTALVTCHELWGSDRMVEARPSVATVTDAFYLPYEHDGLWGLFGSGGDAITDAVDYRGIERALNNQKLDTRMSIDDVDDSAPADEYYYAGRLYNHYGHFLINTLPRFWAIAEHRRPGVPILCHAAGQVRDLFGIPFFSTIFAAVGLKPDDFASFDRPTRLRRVIVPRTSLEEQRSAHRVYGAFCRAIGDRLVGPVPTKPEAKPVYFSKSQLRSGVGAIVNEGELDERLASHGIEICYPERMSIVDQIRLVRERPLILGTAGSFLHTTIFAGAKFIGCINVQSQINTNYTLIDKLSDNRAVYLYPPSLRVEPDRKDFLTARYLPDAARTADAFLGCVIDSFTDGSPHAM